MDNANKCKIQLVNETDGSLFAQSVILDEKFDAYVQPCYDSSRFFALLLVSEQG